MSNKGKNTFAPSVLAEVKQGDRSALEILYGTLTSSEDRVLCEISTMTRRIQRTARETAARVDRMAAALTEGNRYAVTAEGYDGLCALLAVLRSGSSAVLIDPTLPEEARRAQMEQSGATPMTLEESENVAALEGRTFGKEITLFTPMGEAVTLSDEELRMQLLRLETLTSAKNGILSLGDAPKMLLALPLYTGEGITATLWALSMGAVTVYSSDLSAEAILRSVRNHRTDLLIAPPSVYEATERLLSQLIDGRDEKQRAKFEKAMQKAGNGKAFREFHAHLLGTELSFCYCAGGLRPRTATVLAALGHPVTELYCNVHGFLLYRKGSAYLPLAGIEASLDEEKLTLREQNRILSDELDASAAKEGYCLLGERDHLAISEEGDRVYAEQIEHLVDLPRVSESAVLAVEGEHLLICRVPSDLLGVQKQRLCELVAELRTKCPTLRRVLFTYEPLKSTGASAPHKGYLESILSTLPTVSMTASAEGGEDSEVREVLLQMFADVLGCNPSEINPEGHFMIDLGGNSLDYFTLVGEINERFGITLQFEGESFGYSLNDMERKVKELIV